MSTSKIPTTPAARKPGPAIADDAGAPSPAPGRRLGDRADEWQQVAKEELERRTAAQPAVSPAPGAI